MKPTLFQRLENPRNKLIRIYDNPDYADRFTICYIRQESKHNGVSWFPYRAASSHPYDPQGIGLYGESPHAPIDFPCAGMGRKNHLGKRISFSELPADVQRLVVQDLVS
jgi:hypothetical protein